MNTAGQATAVLTDTFVAVAVLLVLACALGALGDLLDLARRILRRMR